MRSIRLSRTVNPSEVEQFINAVAQSVVISRVQLAMMVKLPYPALRDGIFSHPAFSEALNNRSPL
jgi:hypothetical protein